MCGLSLGFPPLGQERPADDIQWAKGHGRIECRELWVVDSQEMTAYLAQVCAWPGARLSGRIRRSRKHTGDQDWESQETHTWVSSLDLGPNVASSIAQLLRGHWTIENGIFRVRDVSYDEDRLHGRQIAYCLSMLRNVAIDIIRGAGYRYVPDGWRDIACKPDHGLYLLQGRLTL